MRYQIIAVALTSFYTLAPSILAAGPEFSVTIDAESTVPSCPPESQTIQTSSHVRVHYFGSINKNSDTERKGNHAISGFGFDFQIDQPGSLEGFNRGLIGLCKGQKATIVLPPEMAFGDRGAGFKIPGGATLDFEVEILEVSSETLRPMNVFDMLDLDRDSVVSKEEYMRYFAQLGNLLPTAQWEREDKNGDGLLSWEEFPLPKGGTSLKDDEL